MRRICQSGDAQGSRRLLPGSSVGERKMERTIGIIQRKESGTCFYPQLIRDLASRMAPPSSPHTHCHSRKLKKKKKKKNWIFVGGLERIRLSACWSPLV